MTSLVLILLGMCIGALIAIGALITISAGLSVLKDYAAHKKMPYRWTCKQNNCDVRFGARSLDMLDELAEEHNQRFHA